MPTVEQVWRALPQGTILVTGGKGIYNEVGWVVALRPTPPGFDRLRGKELVLVDMATAEGLGISLSYLMVSLAEQGASALVVLGEIPSSLKEKSNGYEMPVLQLPLKSDLGSLEKRITTLIREERELLYQKEQELTQKLMEVALTGEGIAAIVNKLKELTGRTIVYLNLDFSPYSAEMTSEFQNIQETIAHLFPKPPSSITGVKLRDGFSAFLSPITGKKEIEGYLLLIAPSAEIQEADRVTAKVGALSLAVELSRQQAVEDIEDKFQVEMVESILNGELPVTAINERAERLGLDLTQSFVVLAVQVSDSPFKGAIIARKTSVLYNNDLCHYRGNLLIIIHPIAANLSPADLRHLGQEIGRNLTDHLNTRITVGFGRVYSGVQGLRASFQEAERALVIGKELFGEGSSSFFGDLGVYRLLLSANPEEVKSFYQDSIGRLVDYDHQHEGELIQTLEATLRYPTLSDTAKALHVHRNTLLYRLQRIQEISDINLDDGETRLNLHLALRAGNVIHVKQFV
jgi:PucR family transcriptional regulator, purine catabolism regulatory protein